MNDMRVVEGCTVVLKTSDDNDPVVYRFAPYVPGGGDVLTPSSPIGEAIIGLPVGTTASVDVRGRQVEVTVVAMRDTAAA